jgi:hypothetical protein
MRVRPAPWFLPAIGFALATATAAESWAYCRASTVTNGQVCFPATGFDSGIPLVWKRPCVGITVQKDASIQVPFDVARDIIEQSFLAWEAPICDGAPPGIHVAYMGEVPCGKVEYNQFGGNTNVLVFRDTVWPHPGGSSDHRIALTTITFDSRTGEIYDADIEVNTTDKFQFTWGDADVQYDLLAVLTHETGHFLGLGHTQETVVQETTMRATYNEGATHQRTLAPDDIDGICAIYPPATIDRDRCNPIPRHGFSPFCLAQQTEGDCSLSPAASTRRAGSSAAAMILVALAALARARSARRARS